MFALLKKIIKTFYSEELVDANKILVDLDFCRTIRRFIMFEMFVYSTA